jgi:hypothetical protein
MKNTAKIFATILIAISLTGCAVFPTEAVQLARIEAEVIRHDRDARSAEARAVLIEFTTISCSKENNEPCIFRAPAGSYDAKGRPKYGFLDDALDGVISFGLVSRVLDTLK